MAVRTQPKFAAWADPLYVFPMPDETPFGLNRSLVGKPIIDSTGHSSMNDNLRLQRLVLQLNEHVNNAISVHEGSQADAADSSAAESVQDVHESIMGTAAAVFSEMSQQSYRADRAMAVDQLWGCLSTYLDHCASLAMSQTTPDGQSDTVEEDAQAADEHAQAAEEEAVSDAGNADRGLAADAAGAEEEAAAPGEEEEAAAPGEEEEAAEPCETAEDASAGEEEQDDMKAEEAEPVAAAGNEEGAPSSDSADPEDLLQENQRLKAQVKTLTARLAQHAQHAQQLLAGTELFFGAQAGSLIGQPLEEEEGSIPNAEEDSDSDESFASARERALSRPLSAASSFRSAHSSGFSSAQSRNLSVSPDKGVSQGVRGGQPGVPHLDRAVQEVLRSSTGLAVRAQEDSEESGPDQASEQRQGRGKRKALRAFLHKLRPSLHDSGTAARGPQPAEPASPTKPSAGAAADRAAAYQFARGLSQKGSAPASPDGKAQSSAAVVSSPFAVDPAGPTPATPQQEAPPSARVRTLSRQFSQQDQPAPQARLMARSLTSTPTRGRGHAMSSIWEQTPTTADTLSAPSDAKLASDSASGEASNRSAEKTSDKASDKASVNADRALRKTASAATPAFAVGSSNNSSAAGPIFSRSITGIAQQKQTTPSAAAMFAFGSSAVPTSGDGNAQVPFAFAAGTDSAATAANAFGQLFGFGKGTPPAAGVAFGGLVGSAFQLAASSSTAAATPQLTVQGQALPDQDAAEAVSEDDVGSDTGKDADKEEEGFALPADLLDDEAQQADAGHHSAADDQSGSDEDAAVTDAEEEQSEAAGGQSDEEDNESEAEADKSEAEGDQSEADGDQSEAGDDEPISDNDATDAEEGSTAAAQSADDQQLGEEEESAEGDEESDDEDAIGQDASEAEEQNSSSGMSEPNTKNMFVHMSKRHDAESGNEVGEDDDDEEEYGVDSSIDDDEEAESIE